MDDYDGISRPAQLPRILEATRKVGFLKTSDLLVGNFLRTLAATKPGGQLLEIGTGTGIATVWLLDGMDDAASLASVDRDSRVQAVGQEILDNDPRVQFFTGEAKAFLESEPAEYYDLIFADGQAGKFIDLDLGLSRLRRGALYIVDNMFMHLFHSPERAARLREFRSALDARKDLFVTKIGWASGVVVCARRG